MKFEIKDLDSKQLMVCLEALGKLGMGIDESRSVLPTYEVEELTDEETLSIVSGDGPIQASQIDSEDTEWNVEVHSSSKAKNKDGTWKKKKVFNKAEEVAPPPPAPVVSAPSAMTYAGFVQAVSDEFGRGKTMSDLKDILREMGMGGISDMRDKPELFGTVLLQLAS